MTIKKLKKLTTKLPQDNYSRYTMNNADIHNQLEATITITNNNQNNYHYKITSTQQQQQQQ